MNVYLFSGVYTIIFYIIERKFINLNNRKLFLLILFIPTFLLSSFHGNISTDYSNYQYIFLRISSTPFLSGLLSLEIEPGFFLLNKFISFFSTNFTVFLIVKSVIILGIYYYLFLNYSSNLSLSLLLLISMGSYYVSFNVIRQFMAAAITILAVINIDKGFKKYFLIIILASSIHYSALVMLLFYPILKINIRNKNGFLFFYFFFFFIFLIFIYTPEIINIITNMIYEGYASEKAFGISTGASILTIFRPLILFIYITLFIKVIDFKKINDRISYNATLIALLITMLTIRVEILNRFSYFFLPYLTIFIPNLNARIRNKSVRLFFDCLIIIVSYIYIYITQSSLEFIWV